MTDHALAVPDEHFQLEAHTTTTLPADLPRLGHAGGHANYCRLSLSDYLVADAPEVPTQVHRSHLNFPWGMLLNDQLGDCGEAMAIHASEAFHLDAATSVPNYTDKDAEYLYEKVAGYVPGDPNTDQGTDNHLLVEYWERHGIRCLADRNEHSALDAQAEEDAKTPTHKIAGSLFVDPSDVALAQRAIWEFVVLFWAVGLPITAKNATRWEDVGGGADGEVASWGYHDVPFLSYDSKWFRNVTWGTELLVSYGFKAKYGVESFVVVTEEMLNQDGVSPAGFDRTKMAEDFASLS